MVSEQEVMGLEQRRIPQDIHSMNFVPQPLALLDENTLNDLHAELHNFYAAENRPWPLLNKRHMDDGLVKATITWTPFGDRVEDETHEHKVLGTTGFTSQNWKALTMTNPYRKTTHREKENMESGSEWTRGSLDLPTSYPTDGKRLQLDFEALRKPVTKLAFENVEEVNEPCLCVRDEKLMNDCKAIARNLCAGPSTPILGKPKYFNSRRGESDFKLEDSLCFGPDWSIQTSIIESCDHAPLISSNMEISSGVCVEGIQSMQAPLISLFEDESDKRSYFMQMRDAENPYLPSQLKSPIDSTHSFEGPVDMWQDIPMTTKILTYDKYRAQNMGAHSCTLTDLTNTPVLSQSSSISIQDSHVCEEICTQQDDHFVILFAKQNTLKGSTGRIIRQELLKLSSLCMRYSRKVLSSVTNLVREQTIKQSLRRIQQTFSSPRRGFVKVNSQKLPEFSSNLSSVSSNRKLAKDEELKAVLMKINEVISSMEKSSPALVQVTHTNG